MPQRVILKSAHGPGNGAKGLGHKKCVMRSSLLQLSLLNEYHFGRIL